MNEREKVEASEALMRWIEDWSGESGETTEATQEEIEAIWFGAWQACRAYLAERGVDYGTEESHRRPRPFIHQHYHAHYGHHADQTIAATRHEGEFSHPHRHGQNEDHHQPW